MVKKKTTTENQMPGPELVPNAELYWNILGTMYRIYEMVISSNGGSLSIYNLW